MQQLPLFRFCPHCKRYKPFALFGLRRKSSGSEIYVQSWCRPCRSRPPS